MNIRSRIKKLEDEAKLKAGRKSYPNGMATYYKNIQNPDSEISKIFAKLYGK